MKGRPWVSARLSIFVAAYNTNQIKRADLPKSYDDLAATKLGSRIGIEAGDSNWLMGMADAMGEARATKLLRDIAAKNGFSPRVGHTLMTNLIASGEVPFALTVDRAGHDYLRTMCEDIGYEVVADIEALPSRLPTLYRKLTE